MPSFIPPPNQAVRPLSPPILPICLQPFPSVGLLAPLTSAVRQQPHANPLRVRLTSLGSKYSSKRTLRAPSSGAHTTSIIGLGGKRRGRVRAHEWGKEREKKGEFSKQIDGERGEERGGERVAG